MPANVIRPSYLFLLQIRPILKICKNISRMEYNYGDSETSKLELHRAFYSKKALILGDPLLQQCMYDTS